MINPINPLSLAGKRIIVTGAASGIGKATACFLSTMGGDLVLIDRDEIGLLETKAECKDTDKTFTFDLQNTAGIKELVSEISSTTGKINGFVHLAGVPYISPLKSLNEDKNNSVYAINTLAALELAKGYSNRRVNGGLPGSIVLISSVYALVGSSGNVGYAMSKAALHGMTKSLAIELAPKQIRVNCIAPGFVKTNMKKSINHFFDDNHEALLQSMHPLGLGEPEDVAAVCCFLLSDLSKWITGSIINVDGGFTAQ